MWAHAAIQLGSILLDSYIQPEYDEPDQLKMGRVSSLMLDAVLLLGRLTNRDKSLCESPRSICASQHTHWLSTVTAGSMLCMSLPLRISHLLSLLGSLTLDGEHSTSKQNLIWSVRGRKAVNSELGVWCFVNFSRPCTRPCKGVRPLTNSFYCFTDILMEVFPPLQRVSDIKVSTKNRDI